MFKHPHPATHHNPNSNSTCFAPSQAVITLSIGFTDPSLLLKPGLTTIFASPDHKHDFKLYNKSISNPFPWVTIFSPSANDSSFNERWPNQHTMTITAPVEFHWFAKWAWIDSSVKENALGEDYQMFKETLVDRLVKIAKDEFPEVKDFINSNSSSNKKVFKSLRTPITTNKLYNVTRGECAGIQYSWARFFGVDRKLASKTVIDGLFLAGNDLTWAGAAGAVISGLICVAACSKKVIAQFFKSILFE